MELNAAAMQHQTFQCLKKSQQCNLCEGGEVVHFPLLQIILDKRVAGFIFVR
jgi:hypothetical protein